MEAGGIVHFHSDLDEEEDIYRTYLLIGVGDWKEMDYPESITVTIEPGGKLNETAAVL